MCTRASVAKSQVALAVVRQLRDVGVVTLKGFEQIRGVEAPNKDLAAETARGQLVPAVGDAVDEVMDTLDYRRLCACVPTLPETRNARWLEGGGASNEGGCRQQHRRGFSERRCIGIAAEDVQESHTDLGDPITVGGECRQLAELKSLLRQRPRLRISLDLQHRGGRELV
eukprot:scaffold78404_cov32-Tisochrysis_lutea.AAC.2